MKTQPSDLPIPLDFIIGLRSAIESLNEISKLDDLEIIKNMTLDTLRDIKWAQHEMESRDKLWLAVVEKENAEACRLRAAMDEMADAMRTKAINNLTIKYQTVEALAADLDLASNRWTRTL